MLPPCSLLWGFVIPDYYCMDGRKLSSAFGEKQVTFRFHAVGKDREMKDFPGWRGVGSVHRFVKQCPLQSYGAESQSSIKRSCRFGLKRKKAL